MKINGLVKRIMAIATIASVAACTGVPAKLAANDPAVSQNVDFNKGRPISARGCGFQLMLFFPIVVNDRLARANNSLASQAHGDYIANIKVTESWKYAFIGTVYCTQLDAMAYPKKSG